jgi:two-component system, NarL family, nitrate/nitrite response regulator NarL
MNMTTKVQAIKILIADDHMMFRDGLKNAFANEAEFQLIGEACDGEEAMAMVKQTQPDVLLLDLQMPGMSGLKVLRSLAKANGNMRIILLSGAVDGEEISAALKLGARGIVLKDATTDMLFKSIRVVMDGLYWAGSQSTASLSQILKLHKISTKDAKSKNYGITPREMEVLQAVVSGYSNREIAGQLSISEQTVKHHMTNIFDKLGVYNRLELTLFVFHHGLIRN